MSYVENEMLYGVSNGEIQNGTFMIPDEVTKIGDRAFWGCGSLNKITIPESVTEIGDSAFLGCFSLTKIEIANSVTKIDESAFYCCESLESIEIPDSVTEIGDYAFYGCCSLKEVKIPDSVTEIGDYAFYDCRSLKTITIPESVTEIGDNAFDNCVSLKEIVIPDSVTEIGSCAFWGCKSLEKIAIPESVTVICEGAFDYCRSLQFVEIMNPDAVIMELHPFFCCENLKTVKSGNKVHPVEYIDCCCMEILSRKQTGNMEIIHAKYFNDNGESYIVREGELSAHGDSIREAMSDLTFKKMQWLDVSEHVARIKAQGYVTPEDYRLVTGACRQGTAQFLKEKGFTWEDRLSIPETLEAVKGYWGAERFTELMTS